MTQRAETLLPWIAFFLAVLGGFMLGSAVSAETVARLQEPTLTTLEDEDGNKLPLEDLDSCVVVATDRNGETVGQPIVFNASSPNGGGLHDITMDPLEGRTVTLTGTCFDIEHENENGDLVRNESEVSNAFSVTFPSNAPEAPTILGPAD